MERLYLCTDTLPDIDPPFTFIFVNPAAVTHVLYFNLHLNLVKRNKWVVVCMLTY